MKEKNLLLVHGMNVSLDCQFDTMPVDRLSLNDFDKYDIIVSSSPLYSSISSEFLEVNKITERIYRRMSWDKLIYTICREAANLYYSRLKVDPNQSQAKAGMIYLIREARHVGMAMGIDTLKMTSIDLDVRAVTDFLIFKSQGVVGLPRDLYFIYRIIKPQILANMPPNQFVVLHRGGSLGMGQFPQIPWHKGEKEAILKVLGIKVEYGDELDYGVDRGTFKTVSDLEHIEIVDLYLSGHSMKDVGNLKDRSPYTVSKEIREHNRRVMKTKFCPRCKRAGGEAFETFVHISRARARLQGRQLLNIVKRLDPSLWCHLFRDSLGADIVKKHRGDVVSVYEVQRILDLERTSTAFRYLRRYAEQKIGRPVE